MSLDHLLTSREYLRESCMRKVMERAVAEGILQVDNTGRILFESCRWLTTSCHTCEESMWYLWSDVSEQWKCLTPESDGGLCPATENIELVIARMCMWLEEEHPCSKWSNYPVGLAGSEDTKKTIEDFAQKRDRGEIQISNFFDRLGIEFISSPKLPSVADLAEMELLSSIPLGLPVNTAAREAEKAQSIRHVKLHIRENRLGEITYPSPEEKDNHIDLIVDGYPIHVVSYSSMGLDLKEEFLYSCMIKLLPIKNSEAAVPEVIAVVHLYTPKTFVEIHRITDIAEKLFPGEDKIVEACKNKYIREGNMRIGPGMLAEIASGWYRDMGYKYRLPIAGEKNHHINIWIEDLTEQLGKPGELLPCHIIFERDGKLALSEENIGYLEHIYTKNVEKKMGVGDYPEIICFLRTSPYHEGGIFFRYAPVP